MSLLPNALLQQLTRKKLGTRRAVASLGIGERRSGAKGPGIEFAEHRPYQIGDDIRYLDPYLQARLGQPFIKQYNLYQQLSVTVLLDTSLSMEAGQPSKLAVAKQIAGGLAYAGLAGGDQVLLGGFAEGRLQWSPYFRGVYRSSEMFAWLARLKADGPSQLHQTLAQAAPRLRRGGMLILVSDWMADGLEPALTVLQSLRQDAVGIQVLSPQELQPQSLGLGSLRLADVESGEELEVELDDGLLGRYQGFLKQWQEELRAGFQRQQGLFYSLSTEDSLETLFLRDFQQGGLLR